MLVLEIHQAIRDYPYIISTHLNETQTARADNSIRRVLEVITYLIRFRTITFTELAANVTVVVLLSITNSASLG